MTAAIVQQQEAALRPLKAKALIGYALGDFGCNLAFTLGSTFLLGVMVCAMRPSRTRLSDSTSIWPSWP